MRWRASSVRLAPLPRERAIAWSATSATSRCIVPTFCLKRAIGLERWRARASAGLWELEGCKMVATSAVVKVLTVSQAGRINRHACDSLRDSDGLRLQPFPPTVGGLMSCGTDLSDA